MTLALVPAAGLGSRMGRPKLLLPLGGRAVLGHVVAALRGGGIDHVLVVAGPDASELVSYARAEGANACVIPVPSPHMRATVEHGLRWLEERFRPGPADPWMLAPADHPAAGQEVVRALLAAYHTGPPETVLVPVFGGKRGHPVLLAWHHVAAIRAHPAEQGLDTYIRSRPHETLDLPVAEPGILRDVDTQEDYKELRGSWTS